MCAVPACFCKCSTCFELNGCCFQLIAFSDSPVHSLSPSSAPPLLLPSFVVVFVVLCLLLLYNGFYEQQFCERLQSNCLYNTRNHSVFNNLLYFLARPSSLLFAAKMQMMCTCNMQTRIQSFIAAHGAFSPYLCFIQSLALTLPLFIALCCRLFRIHSNHFLFCLKFSCLFFIVNLESSGMFLWFCSTCSIYST